jgi:hypothetical protein
MSENQTAPIYHLIYQSSATERLDQNRLMELLKFARRKNEAAGLSGMLLYRNGLYLQYIEGLRSDVYDLLNRLKDDRRHKAIRIIRESTLPDRLFQDWSMAYKNLTGLRGSHVPGYSERLQAQSTMASNGSAEELLVKLFHGMTGS